MQSDSANFIRTSVTCIPHQSQKNQYFRADVLFGPYLIIHQCTVQNNAVYSRRSLVFTFNNTLLPNNFQILVPSSRTLFVPPRNFLQDLRMSVNTRHYSQANAPAYGFRYLPLVYGSQTSVARGSDSPGGRHIFRHNGEILMNNISLLYSICFRRKAGSQWRIGRGNNSQR